MVYPEKVWIGPGFNSTGLFVLGQFWFGHYEDELATDDGYIHAYLKGEIHDAAYDRWARASKRTAKGFWNDVMFTNYVQWIGLKREPGPTVKNYKDAETRLAAILQEHRPKIVWIIGKTQSKYSKQIVEAAGIRSEVTAIRASDEEFEAAWKAISNLLPNIVPGDA